MDVKKAVDFNRGAVAKYYCPFLDFIINTSGNGIVVVVGDVSVGGIGFVVVVPLSSFNFISFSGFLSFFVAFAVFTVAIAIGKHGSIVGNIPVIIDRTK